MPINTKVNRIARPPWLVSSSPTCGPTTSARRSSTSGSIFLQRLGDRPADLVHVLPFSRQQAYRDAVFVAEVLHLSFVEARLTQRLTCAFYVRGLGIRELQHHAAGEVDAEIQTVHEQHHDGCDDGRGRHPVPHLAGVHERVLG